MKNLKRFLSVIFLLVMSLAHAQTLLPLPQKQLEGSGQFILSKKTQIVFNLPQENKERLQNVITFLLKETPKKGKRNRIVLTVTEPEKEAEAWNNASLQGYQLKIEPKEIKLTAPTSMGIFYGLQTLRQLANNNSIKCAQITDAPKFRHRGLMIDTSRHFWSKEFIKKQMDAMVYFKLNRLHLHLTDGGGWRLQIDKYPELTQKTAYRKHSNWDKKLEFCQANTPNAYGGFYTKEDIRELIVYAQERFITIIPEIEMPGHSNEVLHAFPELSCSGKPIGFELCIANPKTFTFLTHVLEEVIELFPSKYIHVGGDEASVLRWKDCSKCIALYQKEQMTDTIQLQSHLIRRIDSFLTKKGKKMIGWDEILEGNKVSEGATVLSWRGEEGGVTAAKLGHHAIMSPGKFCYLDLYQDEPSSQPKALGGYVPLAKTYSYNPIPSELQGTPFEKYIDGVQGNLWTEYIETEQHAEYMMYPRLTAIAEVGWGYKSDYTDFKQRVINIMKILHSWGYNSFDITKEIGKLEK